VDNFNCATISEDMIARSNPHLQRNTERNAITPIRTFSSNNSDLITSLKYPTPVAESWIANEYNNEKATDEDDNDNEDEYEEDEADDVPENKTDVSVREKETPNKDEQVVRNKSVEEEITSGGKAIMYHTTHVQTPTYLQKRLLHLVERCGDEKLSQYIEWKTINDVQSLRTWLKILANTVTCSLEEENMLIHEWEEHLSRDEEEDTDFVHGSEERYDNDDSDEESNAAEEEQEKKRKRREGEGDGRIKCV